MSIRPLVFDECTIITTPKKGSRRVTPNVDCCLQLCTMNLNMTLSPNKSTASACAQLITRHPATLRQTGDTYNTCHLFQCARPTANLVRQSQGLFTVHSWSFSRQRNQCVVHPQRLLWRLGQPIQKTRVHRTRAHTVDSCAFSKFTRPHTRHRLYGALCTGIGRLLDQTPCRCRRRDVHDPTRSVVREVGKRSFDQKRRSFAVYVEGLVPKIYVEVLNGLRIDDSGVVDLQRWRCEVSMCLTWILYISTYQYVDLE